MLCRYVTKCLRKGSLVHHHLALKIQSFKSSFKIVLLDVCLPFSPMLIGQAGTSPPSRTNQHARCVYIYIYVCPGNALP